MLRTFFKLAGALAQEMEKATADAETGAQDRKFGDMAATLRETERRMQQKQPAKPSAEEKRRQSARVIVERRKTERVLSTDMPFTFADMAKMTEHLRPGMGTRELDAIDRASHGILTADLLKSKTAWNKAYDQRPPCLIDLTKSGVIDRVLFPYHDPENLHHCKTVHALLDAYPEAARDPAREISGTDATPEQVAVFPDTGKGYRLVVNFMGGLIRQPGTALATALHLFWYASGQTWLLRTDTAARPEKQLVQEINDRVAAGFYKTPVGGEAIAYEPPAHILKQPELMQQLRPLIAPEFFEPIPGRALSAIPTGFPPQWADYIT